MKTVNNKLRCFEVWRLASLLAVIIFYAGSQAQESGQLRDRFKPPPSGQPAGDAPAPGIIISPNEDHRIGPGDVVDVQINRAPELCITARVTADGTFLMPVLGRVHAQKKTAEELAEEIAGKLRGDYLKAPIVKVMITQIYSQTYFLQGAVRRSGIYQVEGQPTLLELLTVGGGVAENHGTTAFIIRRVKPKPPETAPSPAGGAATDPKDASPDLASQPTNDAPAFEMLQANIAGLLKGRFDQNLKLEPGDIVNIPTSDVFFVAGEVREPGSFPLKDGTTLRQAISLAQGITPRAAGSRGVIYRENGSAQRQEIKVDIDAVMKGKKGDMALLANDIVIIPNSAFKSTALPILNAFGTGVSWAMGGRL
ncbi:MAG TPA: polysaccharide biosynthesis/export family protein [Blastocatellia bacterium]